MARRYNKRRNYRRRRRRNTTAAKANAALRIAKKANQKENKYHTTIINPTSVPHTGLIPPEFCSVAPGDTVNNREGNIIQGSSIKFRGALTKNPSATATRVRMIVFQYLEPGGLSGATDYLASATINSFKSSNRRFNSRTLMDRTFVLDEADPMKPLNFTIRTPFKIFYQTSGNTPNKNGVYCILISNESVNQPEVNWQARFQFKEF